MYEQVEKPKENKSRAVDNAVGQKKRGVKPGFGIVDNRPKAVTQLKLQEMANNHSAQQQNPIQKKENNIVSSDNLNSGIENLSSFPKPMFYGSGIIQMVKVSPADIGKSYNILTSSSTSSVIGKLVQISGGGWYKFDVSGSTVNVQGEANIISEVTGGAGVYQAPMPELSTWTEDSTGFRPTTPFGQVSATHKRGAPYLSSRAGDYGGVQMGDTYKEFIKALRSGGKTDQQIAQALLNKDHTSFTTDGEKRGAAMMHATVNLAEEWRKHGASKICRGELRRIINGHATFDSFIVDFSFVESADAGRRQVGRMHEAQYGAIKPSDLPSPDKEIFAAMSQPRPGDLSSDDDERKRKTKAVKKKRVFSSVVHDGSSSD